MRQHVAPITLNVPGEPGERPTEREINREGARSKGAALHPGGGASVRIVNVATRTSKQRDVMSRSLPALSPVPTLGAAAHAVLTVAPSTQ